MIYNKQRLISEVFCRMKQNKNSDRRFRLLSRKYNHFLFLLLAFAGSASAQDPWTASANNMKTAFTGPIVTSLIAVAVVITGITFAFSEGQGKRQLAGLVFGGSMALGAVRFMAWIFT